MELPDKKVVISVTSDLVTDQRVHRTATTLREQGALVLLVGRQRRASMPMASRIYYFKRFRLPFETGTLFYATFNIRLFLFLLVKKVDLLVANDLDTLPANYLAARLKGIPLIYDSHEYFTEVPELEDRPLIKRFWKRIEQTIFPKLKYVITVNGSIADLYHKEYGVEVRVVRNVPMVNPFEADSAHQAPTRQDYGLPSDSFIFLIQGSGINIHRGAEEAMEAIASVPGAALLFIGGGDVIGALKSLAESPLFQGKVYFIPKLPLQELRKVTVLADAGLTLDRNTNLNYRFSLPNKLFDYIHAGLPVLASDLPEIRKVVETYDVGMIIPSHDPQAIAATMRYMMEDRERIARWKENLTFAASELDWRNERSRLLEVVRNVS